MRKIFFSFFFVTLSLVLCFNVVHPKDNLQKPFENSSSSKVASVLEATKLKIKDIKQSARSGSKITDDLSEYVAKIPPDVVLVVVVLFIFYLSFFRGVPQLRRIKKFGFRLEGETKKITQSEEYIDFESIKKQLPEFKYLINEFKELLTDKIGNTQNSEFIFSEENVFQTLNVDETALQHYPGIFTALGIAGTFIGILFVLVRTMKNGIEATKLIDQLLQGAGVAFLTSIIGITASLIFLSYERRILGRFRKKLYDFQVAINSKLVRVTPESLLAGIKDSLETMADDIGVAVSKQVSETINKFTEVMEASIAKAGSSSQEIVQNVFASIEGTLDKFSNNIETMEATSSIQSDILEQLNRSIENVIVMADKLETTIPLLERASTNIELSSKRFEQLPDALKQLIESQEEFMKTMGHSIAFLKESWESERARIVELTEKLAGQFTTFEEGIVSGLQVTMSKFDDELSRAGTYVATWLDRLHKDVEEFISQTKTFENALQDSTSGIQDRINELGSTLNKHNEMLVSQISSFHSSLSVNIEELKSGLVKLPMEMQNVITNIESIYKQVTQKLPEVVAFHLDKLSRELDATARKGWRGLFSKH